MALCTLHDLVEPIKREECIGNSLETINNNTAYIRDQVCENFNKLNGLETTVKDLNMQFPTLSGRVYPGFSKAWVKFSGKKDKNGEVRTDIFTDRLMYASFNVASVYRQAIGSYRVYFNEPFDSNAYAVIATSSENKSNVDNTYTWAQPFSYNRDFVAIRVHGSRLDSTIDPDYMSVVIM